MDGAAEAFPRPGASPDDALPLVVPPADTTSQHAPSTTDRPGPDGAPSPPDPAGDDRTDGERWESTCPFLSAIAADDRLRTPILAPDTANRCLSSGVPTAVLGRDQAALCLDPAHETCPRYVRATMGPVEGTPVQPDRGISLPILAAVALLVVAAVVGGISVAARGDLSAGAASSAAPGAVAVPTATSPAAVGESPAPASADAGVVAPGSSPGLAAAPGAASAAPSAAATPAPTPIPPSPTPAAYPGLTPCPRVPDCYVYVVKRGDNLTGVATRYGLTLDEVLAKNPKITDPSRIVNGQKIRLPTPRSRAQP